MAFDGFVVRSLVHNLSETLQNGRLDKIHQPLPRDIVLTVRANGQNHRLLLSANPTYPRFYLETAGGFDNPAEAPMFCMLLRKQLEGAKLVSITQVGNDRQIHFTFEVRNELGDLATRLLVLEIMGRHSNLILLDPETDRILDSLVHVNRSTSSYREILPGRTYVTPPKQDKHNPFETPVGEVMNSRSSQSELPFDKFLVGYYEGMSPVLAREFAARAVNSSEETVLYTLLTKLSQHQYEPALAFSKEGAPIGFSILPLTHLGGMLEPFRDINEMIARYYAEKTLKDAVSQKAGDLEHLVRSEIEKNRQKLVKFASMKEEAKEAEQFRILGELLTAHLHEIPRGASEISLTNYYSDAQESVQIKLDPELTPNQNAQAYFRRYNKAKKSIPAIEEQEQISSGEIDYLEGILVQLENATWSDIEQIREELSAEGYLKRARGKRILPDKTASAKKSWKTGRETIPKPAKFVSSEGVEIWVGKNNRQNDALTFKLSHSTDTWLHTKDIPGSHVLIRGRDFTESTLLEAASLAAYFSKARESSQVPVDYTAVKNVWKPNGAKPGFVLYDKGRTLFVTPKLL